MNFLRVMIIVEGPGEKIKIIVINHYLNKIGLISLKVINGTKHIKVTSDHYVFQHVPHTS